MISTSYPLAVRINSAFGYDPVPDDRHQRLAGGILDDLHMNPATPLQQPENRHSSGCATSQPAPALAAGTALIRPDLAGQQVRAFLLRLTSDDLSKVVKATAGGIAMNTGQSSRPACRRASNRMLDQALLSIRSAGLPCVASSCRP